MAEMSWGSEQHIDTLLDSLEDDWEKLPDLAARFDEWDPVAAETFVFEWPTHEIDLKLIEQFIAQGKVGRVQRDRYERLKELMERNRVYLPKILGDGYAQD